MTARYLKLLSAVAIAFMIPQMSLSQSVVQYIYDSAGNRISQVVPSNRHGDSFGNRSYCVLSQLEESSLTSISSIKYGEALFVFAPTPKSENVRFVNSNKDIIKCFKDPCWLKCEAYNCSKKDIRLINENIETFQGLGLFPYNNGRISQKDIDKLEGGEVRLMNLLLCRLKQEDFIELNVAGLSYSSIEKLLDFVVNDIHNNSVAYLVVAYTDFVITKTNPISICPGNIKHIINELEIENTIRKSHLAL